MVFFGFGLRNDTFCYMVFFFVCVRVCVCVWFTAHKFRFSARRNKPGNGKRVDHQQQIINSKGVVFRYRLLLLRSVKCKFGHRQGSYIKRLEALNYTRKYTDRPFYQRYPSCYPRAFSRSSLSLFRHRKLDN